MKERHNSHIVLSTVAGAVFGTAVVAWPFYVSNAEKPREISFLRAEYFAAKGLALKASDIAERSVDLSARLALEVTALQREHLIDRLSTYISHVNKKVPSSRIARALVVSAETHGLDVLWWTAQIEQESHFNPQATGKVGEAGLAQILPSTAKRLGMGWGKRFNIETNLDFGARYMAKHLRDYKSIEKAQSRYNGGGGEYSSLIRKRRGVIKNA